MLNVIGCRLKAHQDEMVELFASIREEVECPWWTRWWTMIHKWIPKGL